MRPPVSGWLATPLLAAFAVLRVAAASPGEYASTDLALTLAATVAVGAAVAASIHFTMASRGATRDTMRGVDLILAAGTALFFWGLPVALAFRDAAGLSLTARYVVIAVFFAIVCLVGVAWRRGATFERPARITTMASVVLLVGVCTQLIVQQAQWRSRLREDPLIAAIGKPLPPGISTPTSAGAPRDIYLLILDARANAHTLKKFFGYDDAGFTDSLRALGFVIPRTFHSNYVHTGLSVPSLLNFTHVNGIRRDRGDDLGQSIARVLVERNRTAVFLKGQGYRYWLFPSEWYALTARSPLADHTFQATPFWDARQVLGTEFRRAVFNRTPVMRLPWSGDPTSHPRRSLAGLKQVAEDPRPTFVVAHFLLPHTPYVFSDDCRAQLRDPRGDLQLKRQLYITQVRCADALVLDAVTGILSRSERRPIILLVSDHGSRVTPFTASAPLPAPSPALEERFGAFGAFLTPDAPEDLFGGELTLVNVMQRVLVTYFGVDIPPSADRFFGAESRALDFQEVSATAATGRTPSAAIGPVDFP